MDKLEHTIKLLEKLTSQKYYSISPHEVQSHLVAAVKLIAEELQKLKAGKK